MGSMMKFSMKTKPHSIHQIQDKVNMWVLEAEALALALMRAMSTIVNCQEM